MPSSRILLGTSARRPGGSLFLWRAGLPAGVAHGVPDGDAVALCGAVPAYVWRGSFTRESRVLDVCGSCRALVAAGTLGSG